MKNTQEIVGSLLDVDGSCRDVNFENPTWDGLEAMLRFLAKGARFSAKDSEGVECAPSLGEVITLLTGEGGWLLSTGGAAPVSPLQVFVFREKNGLPFVELTFFPGDVAASPTLGTDFVRWVEIMKSHLGASRAFVRYEDACWSFGDVGPSSGVFLVLD